MDHKGSFIVAMIIITLSWLIIVHTRGADDMFGFSKYFTVVKCDMPNNKGLNIPLGFIINEQEPFFFLNMLVKLGD